MTWAWYESSDEVVAFASDALAAGWFDSAFGETSTEAENLLSFFEKPWHYTPEHTWWVANGRPNGVEIWEVGVETDFGPSKEWVLKASEPFDEENDSYLYWLVDKGWVAIGDASIFKASERTLTIDGEWEAYLD